MLVETLKKLKEVLLSVLPVLVVVLILYFSKVASFEQNNLITFCISVFLVILGMWLFNLGADSSMRKMGELVGSTITKKQSMFLLVLIFFLFGSFITIAEPDLAVLAEQIPDNIMPDWVLILVIGVGVGIFLVIGALRILFQKSLKVWLLAFYGLMFAICCLVDYQFIPMALDSGGVTTGPITVPFILAIGVGIASSRAGNKSDADSFGLVAFASIGPILVVLILALTLRNQSLTYDIEQVANSNKIANIGNEFISALVGQEGTLFQVAVSIFPILAFFIVYELIFIRLSFRKIVGYMLGILLVFVGLVLFLTAVKVGFLPIGQELGKQVANESTFLLVGIGALLGLVAVFAEPAVYVLTSQVETVSEGTIKRISVLLSIAIGNAIAIGVSMLRVKLGFNLLYILVPGYFIAFLLSFIVPNIYSAIAFDSGGVVSGPMNSTFILPFAIGACYAINGADSASSIMTDAFGTIALVALMPLISVQILGLTGTLRIYQELRIARNRNKDEFDNQIIHF